VIIPTAVAIARRGQINETTEVARESGEGAISEVSYSRFNVDVSRL